MRGALAPNPIFFGFIQVVFNCVPKFRLSNLKLYQIALELAIEVAVFSNHLGSFTLQIQQSFYFDFQFVTKPFDSHYQTLFLNCFDHPFFLQNLDWKTISIKGLIICFDFVFVNLHLTNYNQGILTILKDLFPFRELYWVPAANQVPATFVSNWAELFLIWLEAESDWRVRVSNPMTRTEAQLQTIYCFQKDYRIQLFLVVTWTSLWYREHDLADNSLCQ